jgi:uncharacterized membrane protein YphA (DoxX/SURF4 family)
MKMKLFWGLRGLVALAFLISGGMKLIGNPIIHGRFELWGYPDWFCYLVGVIEILGAAGLLMTRLTQLTTAILGVTMVGALVTHFTHSEANEAAPAFILLAFLATIFWVLRNERRNKAQAGDADSRRAA